MPGLVRTISNTFGITEDSERDFEGLSTIARRKRIILPTSTFRGFWDWFIIVLVLYNAVSIPLEIGFETSTPLAQRFLWMKLVRSVFAIAHSTASPPHFGW